MSQEMDHDNAERLAAMLALIAAASDAQQQQLADEDEGCLEEDGGLPPTVDTLDGYLTALVCGPLSASPLEAMDALFGADWAQVLEEQEQTEAFVEALHVRWNEIVAALDPEQLAATPEAMRLEPLITEFDEATRAGLLADGVISAEQLDSLPAPGVLWCEGFLLAVQDHEDDWYLFDEDSAEGQMLDTMLLAIAAVALPEGEQREAYIDEAYDEDVDVDQDVLLDDALFSAQDLRLFWVQNASPADELAQD